MTIGKRIKQLRLAADMTMDGLGALMRSEEKPDGLTKQTVSAWESSRNQLNVDQALRLCEIFKVSIGWLLTGDNSLSEARQHTRDAINLVSLTDHELEIISVYRQTSYESRIVIDSTIRTSPRLTASEVIPIDKWRRLRGDGL